MAEIKRVNYTHDALIDYIIANPASTQRNMAALFGYTEAWISQVMSSDSFKVRLAARKKECVDPILIHSVEERLGGVVDQSLAIIAEKLEATRNVNVALRALDISSRALGYGARDRTSVNVQANFVVALPTKAQNSGEWAQEHAPQVIEVQAVAVNE